MNLFAQATQPSGMANWTPEQWTAFLTQLALFVAAVFGAYKGVTAGNKADANAKSLDRIAPAVHQALLASDPNKSQSPPTPTPESIVEAQSKLP